MSPDPEGVVKAHCNDCGGRKNHHRVSNYRYNTNETRGGVVVTVYCSVEVLECNGCGSVKARRLTDLESQSPSEEYLPLRCVRKLPEWADQLSTEIRILLGETCRALDAEVVSLAMMGSRSVMDLLLNEKVGDIGGFEAKVEALSDQGFLAEKQKKTILAALDVGSAVAHRGHRVDEATAHQVLDIVDGLLRDIYVSPGVASRLAEQTPTRPPRPKRAKP